jgi:NAD(P)-dependent dehydrogenase (short-subunit alcohol dehydrogenase family)
VAAERGAEGAGRTVSDPFGDRGEPEVFAPEQILRDGHAPAEQILHRRKADGAREAIEERRTRLVNVTSSVALAPMPLVAVYPASKTAIEGCTGSLAHELAAFKVRVKLVEPGYAPTTRFAQNTGLRIDELIPEAYAPFAQPIFAAFAQPALVTTESDVAEAVWRAANDDSAQLRFPAGADAVALARVA